MKRKKQMSESFLTIALLSLSGGLQDAYTYLCRGRVFANAQTGNVVLLAVNLFEGNFEKSLRYFIPIVSFAVGVAVAEIIRLLLKAKQTIHWRQVVCAIELVLLVVVGFLPERLNILANSVVSFSCALQVQSFRFVQGRQFSSTMCIGNIRSGIESLVRFIATKDKQEMKNTCVYFGVILLFALGAVLGDLLSVRLGLGAIWFSSSLLLIVLCLMFIPDKMGDSTRSK